MSLTKEKVELMTAIVTGIATVIAVQAQNKRIDAGGMDPMAVRWYWIMHGSQRVALWFGRVGLYAENEYRKRVL
jgi:hypothetical protein